MVDATVEQHDTGTFVWCAVELGFSGLTQCTGWDLDTPEASSMSTIFLCSVFICSVFTHVHTTSRYGSQAATKLALSVVLAQLHMCFAMNLFHHSRAL